ncbi:MAG: response regulator transcription factor [Acidobacteria bacterium]|nr:response regulator transcription factor [Acidobacteriota bacterium]
MLRIVIIDDEPPARKKLKMFLKNTQGFEIVGEAGDGLEAVTVIQNLRPDLIFLDIQMPHLTGFEVLEELELDIMPKVIFTTAYDQYAIKAFEIQALDYLLKPFDEERFQEALKRALTKTSNQDQLTQINDLLLTLKNKQKYLQRILLKTNNRMIVLKTDDINWIDAEEKYVNLHAGKHTYLHRENISSLEQQLDPEKFIRIHRSNIINIDFLQEITPWTHGDYVITLKDGTKLNLGRNYKDRLLAMFS